MQDKIKIKKDPSHCKIYFEGFFCFFLFFFSQVEADVNANFPTVALIFRWLQRSGQCEQGDCWVCAYVLVVCLSAIHRTYQLKSSEIKTFIVNMLT